jgi:N-acetyltransferase
MPWATPLTLRGSHVRLEPLTHAHHDALLEAVRDGELWKHWYTLVPSPEQMRPEIDRRLTLQAQGLMLPFAVVEASSQTCVGMTTYMNIEEEHRRLEIGSTWYRNRVQRTPLNTEAKLMLLRHAFESYGCIAVEFRTHFFNHQSRKAIERLGAKLDGVLRNHRVSSDGTLRDTCVYSIASHEWPTVRSHLTYKLSR